ncbi:MAG: CHASE domain-containing protein [Sulfuricurvum sp.]|nr:CHASE domain-containing protein [Sulfuricurvum sp.]
MKPLHSKLYTTKNRLHHYWLEKRYDRIIGAIVSIAVLIGVWILLEHYYRIKTQEKFDHLTHEHQQEINIRLHNYIHLLRSGTALFYSSDVVTRDEWHRFVEMINPKKYYPGIQGIGYSKMVYTGEEDPIRKQLRSDGFSLYTLTGDHPIRSAIIYLEPLDKRNQNAIGYDMYSEPTRRAAMDYAAKTAGIGMSGKVTLVQEIDENIQPGFLIYLPIFSDSTYSKNNKKLQGFVYSPIRAGDFFATIPSYHEKLIFEVYDGQDLLYSSLDSDQETPAFHNVKRIKIGGRTWTIHYYSSITFEQKYSSLYPIFFAIGIAFFNLLLLYIIFDLVRKRIKLKRKTKETEKTKIWLDRLLNFSADGIHILDMNGKLVGYSPTFRTMLGYDESELDNIDVFAWDVHLDPEIIKVMMEKLTENTVTFESVFRRKDAVMIDVEVKAHIFYEDGQKYIFASTWNITEQKRAKQALQCEKELAQNYLDIVEVMILVIGTDYTIHLINRKGSEILGYSPEDAIGKNFIDLFIPERFRSQLRNVADEIINFDCNEYYENPIVTKNGVERLIAWRNRPLHDLNGEVSSILSTGEDITDIRRTQEVLVERESFYKTIFTSVSDAIIILENHFVIDCNEQALKIFETDLENFIGRYIFHIAYDIECHEKSFVESVDFAYEGNQVDIECSFRIHSHDSEPKITEISLSSFGKVQDNKLIMVIRDITHKVEEQKILTMNARQAQMGEMISMIAHQWRQPLAIINAITSQIRMKQMLSDNEDQALIENLIKIEHQSTHLSQTISDYRDFFRPDKPKERFQIASLIDHAVSLVDHALKNNSIRIEKSLEGDPILFTYRNELLQVIIVLLKNSLDAFSENKILGGEIIFNINTYNESCRITVRDNAGGIQPSIIKKLFIPYFTTKPKSGGTGLGLYMSKLIIEEHCNGTLDVQSAGENTIFTITLPYQKEHNDDT